MLLNNNMTNEDHEDPTMETDRHVQVFLNSTFDNILNVGELK